MFLAFFSVVASNQIFPRDSVAKVEILVIGFQKSPLYYEK
jgi:hypothetical protein